MIQSNYSTRKSDANHFTFVRAGLRRRFAVLVLVSVTVLHCKTTQDTYKLCYTLKLYSIKSIETAPHVVLLAKAS